MCCDFFSSEESFVGEDSLATGLDGLIESGIFGTLGVLDGGRGGEGVRSAEDVVKPMNSSKSDDKSAFLGVRRCVATEALPPNPVLRLELDRRLEDEGSDVAEEKSATSELDGSGDSGLAIMGEEKDGGGRSDGAKVDGFVVAEGGGGTANPDGWEVGGAGVGSDDWKSSKSSSANKSRSGVAVVTDDSGGGASNGACVVELRGALTMMGVGVCERDVGRFRDCGLRDTTAL